MDKLGFCDLKQRSNFCGLNLNDAVKVIACTCDANTRDRPRALNSTTDNRIGTKFTTGNCFIRFCALSLALHKLARKLLWVCCPCPQVWKYLMLLSPSFGSGLLRHIYSAEQLGTLCWFPWLRGVQNGNIADLPGPQRLVLGHEIR